MMMCRDVKLKKGYHTSNYKQVDIVDSETEEVIAEKVKVEYANLIIKAVNGWKEAPDEQGD